ncbi:MAG: carbon-nitrogen hydrolase family protein [Candidatus Thermoplasmatota archaeon]|nr:carbon-nitrogen hydrolase family protein [Candidatus Thermoplasmatota archaeon]
MKNFKVAIAQMDIVSEKKELNLKKADELSLIASEKGADFICLPEYFSTGSIPEKFNELAETIPGNTTNKLCEIAKKNKIAIAASIIEKSKDTLYNTAVLIDSKGDLLGKQRKIHLFLEEATVVSNGKKCEVISTVNGKIGLMVCYDTIFPEVSRKLAMNGAQMIFIPANWPDPFSTQWKIALSARALDNQIWIVAANRCGKDDTYTYFGKSMIINPYGEIVYECGNEEDLMVWEIELKKADEFKAIINFLKDRKNIELSTETMDKTCIMN